MKILILSPHTDDAELGSGGTIAKMISEGHEILWVVFSIAGDSLPQDLPKDTLKREFLEVAEHLGIHENGYRIYDFRVRHLDEKRQEILEDLVKIRQSFRPDLVIMPSLNDRHQDHQVVSNEAVRAFKMQSSIIGYELPWNHITFDTSMFVRLDKSHIETKFNLLSHYRSQFQVGRGYFSSEYVYGLAKVRGTQCNSAYAEAFEVVRWII
ncbi:Diacetylchitobiose deacetylase [uncultured archaeon]|nr:Diacetylchitobiose deacetylase [uncultured archaeon]